MQRENRIVTAFRKKYSYERMQQDICLLSERYPHLCRYETIGRSEDDRNIYAVTIGNPCAPKHLLVIAAIHGREYMTSLLCMKQIEYYLRQGKKREGQGNIAQILRQAAIHYIPMANPDGVTISQYGSRKIQKKPLQEQVKKMAGKGTMRWKANVNGVDLNRNFPYHFYVTGFPGKAGYSGKKAVSEKESRALLAYIENLKKQGKICGVIHYHAMGNEIFGFCQKGNSAYYKTAKMYGLATQLTGYSRAEKKEKKFRCKTPAWEMAKQSNNGNLREYLLYDCNLPGITIEIGRLPCPGPIWEFPWIWRKNRELVIRQAELFL